MSERDRTSRRRFLQTGAAVITLPHIIPASAFGANERVRFVLVGCGGRGRAVAHFMIGAGAQCVGLCDLRSSRRNEVTQFLDQYDQTGDLRQHQYIEQVLERKDVDAVIIATPDHWHAPLAIQACQAGKDVYVEKPQAHNIWESSQLIKAARKYKRIVQVGTQNRSAPYNHSARQYIEQGKIGPIHLVKVFNLKSGGPFSLQAPKPVPTDLDWDRWLGPVTTPWEYRDNLFHGGWHHFWDFSGGDLCDDAAHQVDLALMMMGNPGLPKSVYASGGRLAHQGDDSEVPDLLVVQYQYDDFILTLEHSNYPKYMQKTSSTIRRKDLHPHWLQNATRVELYGKDQMMVVGRHGGGWQATTYPWRVHQQMYGRPGDEPHAKNFVESIKSRQQPHASAETLHAGVCLLHMANISHRLGMMITWNDAKQCFDQAAANEMIRREYRAVYEVPEVC